MEETIKNQRKIAIVGPESSGKTTLCKYLHNQLGIQWIPEFAREYLEKKVAYSKTDLDYMLKQQLLSELENHSPLLLCDTEAISFKIWSQYKFGVASNFILKQSLAVDYALYLLLYPDVEYQKDSLRENEDLQERKEIFELYKKELEAIQLPYFVITGQYEDRFNKAIKILQEQKLV